MVHVLGALWSLHLSDCSASHVWVMEWFPGWVRGALGEVTGVEEPQWCVGLGAWSLNCRVCFALEGARYRDAVIADCKVRRNPASNCKDIFVERP